LAFTGLAVQHDGWQRQADHLALTHKAVGLAAVVVADQARQRPALLGAKHSRASGRRISAAGKPQEPQAAGDGAAVAGLPPDTDQSPNRVADPGRHVSAVSGSPAPHVELATVKNLLARKTAVVALLDERVRRLAAEAATKDSRLAELEASVAALREDVAHRENENRSLHASLDLAGGENKRLAGSLAKSVAETAALRAEIATMQTSLAAAARDANELEVAEFLRLSQSAAEIDGLRAELEQTKARLAATAAERDKLASALDAARQLHHNDLHALRSRLEAVTSRAAAAESLLGDIERYLLARAKATANKGGSAAEPARKAASKALDLLEAKINDVQKYEQEREQSRAALKAATGSLLNLFETRLAALAEAQNAIEELQQRLAAAQADAILQQTKIDSLTAALHSERSGRAAIEASRSSAQSDDCAPSREPANRAAPNNAGPNERAPRDTPSLLAGTISF
jgi:chromosome segregation ATPase